MLKLIIVLLYMITEWLDWMKPMPALASTPQRKLLRTAVRSSRRAKPTRTTHVRGQVEDVLAALDDPLAVVVDAQIHQVELVAEHLLLHAPCVL
jgi:hypothetical protein